MSRSPVRICSILLLVAIACWTWLGTPAAIAATPETATTYGQFFAGNWTYRNYANDPDIDMGLADIGGAIATLTLEEPEPGVVSGSISNSGFHLTVDGTYEIGKSGEEPYALKFSTYGIVNGEPWLYDYVGYVFPQWDYEQGQIPVIGGSFVRILAHSSRTRASGISPAGEVRSYLATKQDS